MRTLLIFLSTATLFAQSAPRARNAFIEKVVESVDAKRIEESLRKLESFETRGNFSETDHPTRGIGAARRWIAGQFREAGGRLQVRFDSYKLKKQSRIFRDVELVNVVAVLPGNRFPDRRLLISGHYDSLNLRDARRTPGGGDPTPEEQERSAQLIAPGVSDDASGVAAAIELARVLSQHEFEKTLVFVAFAGEEIGLAGATLHAQKATAEKQVIEAVLNSDIIGTEVSGDGRRINRAVRVFSADPPDSPSRQLARYIKEIGERYYPRMETSLVFRHDRIGRGGDHTAFALEGFPAVRFTSAVENYAHQHSATDTLANASPDYVAHVTRIKAAVAASLALAPPPPITSVQRTRFGETATTANLSRGKSGYDALLNWKEAAPVPDLAGYAVVLRSTLAPYWEKEIFAGKATQLLIPGVDIDNHIFGVKAIDTDGNESMVSAYVPPPPRARKLIADP
jgi:hypothetical protein